MVEETADKTAAAPTIAPEKKVPQEDAQARAQEQAKADDLPQRSSTSVKEQVGPHGQTLTAITNQSTIFGGPDDDDDSVKTSGTLSVNANGQVTGIFNVTAHTERNISTPAGDIHVTADSSVGGQSVNGRLKGTLDTTVQATRDVAGDSSKTGVGITIRVEHSRNEQQTAQITGDPFKGNPNGIVADAGVLASVQQHFRYLTLTGTAFGGVESYGRSARPYAETAIGVDGNIPDLKHAFRNGVSVGVMDTNYHAACIATIHGPGWETSLSTTVVKTPAGNFETRYQRSGGPVSSTFGPDKGVPNNGFMVSFRLTHRK